MAFLAERLASEAPASKAAAVGPTDDVTPSGSRIKIILPDGRRVVLLRPADRQALRTVLFLWQSM